MQSEQQGSSSTGARSLWPDIVRRLLSDIHDGCKAAKENEPLVREFHEADKRLRDAEKKVVNVANSLGAHRDEEKVLLDRELEARNLEHKNCASQVTALYQAVKRAFAFIGPFRADLNSLLTRLPLTPKFGRYGQELAKLSGGLIPPEAWLEENSTLDLVKQRLLEMLDFANNHPPAVPASKRAGLQRHQVCETPDSTLGVVEQRLVEQKDFANINPPQVGASSSTKRGGTHQVCETPEQRATRRRNFVSPILDSFGWSINRLATESAVGKATVYGYLDGSRKSITRRNRQALAEVLKVDLTKLPK